MVRFPSFGSDSDGKIISDGDSDDKEEDELQKCSAVPPERPYSLDGDETIMNFICKTKNHSWIKCIKMWEEAFRDQICPGRSAISMKSRFLKYIIFHKFRNFV
jgi:hypothetical protein